MEREAIYKVVSSLSDGYVLININNFDDKRICKIRKNVTFKSGKVIRGDLVNIDSEDNICNILERYSLMQRPKLVNVDYVLVLISCKQPNYNSYLLDKYLLTVNYNHIQPIIIFTKTDLLSKEELEEINKEIKYYDECGVKSFLSNKFDVENNKIILDFIKGKSVCLMGQTGVGKSSLINTFSEDFNCTEGDYSLEKMKRGQHITKAVTFMPFNEGFIADTPGFSSFEIKVGKIEVSKYFPGFLDLSTECKFNDCLHNKDIESCAVTKKYLHNDKIYINHYNNYLKILQEIEGN